MLCEQGNVQPNQKQESMIDFSQININNPVICWFSGGITSAVSCKLAIDLFGADNCSCIFMDTQNEDPDTYRFKDDC